MHPEFAVTLKGIGREEKVAGDAQTKLYEQEMNLQAQMREMRGHLQAQQAHTTALQQALEAAKAQHAQDMLDMQQEREKAELAKEFLNAAQATEPICARQGKLHWARTLRTAKHQVTQMLEEATLWSHDGWRCSESSSNKRRRGIRHPPSKACDLSESSSSALRKLNAELDDTLRSQAEQQSVLSRRLEYVERDLKSEEKAYGEAQWKLRQHEHKMAAQSKAGCVEHLQSVSAYQGGELMKLQQEVYHLRALLSSQGINPALASGLLVSPWSQASTPAHLRDISSPSSSSLYVGNQSLRGSPAVLWSHSRASEAKTATTRPSSEHGHDSELPSLLQPCQRAVPKWALDEHAAGPEAAKGAPPLLQRLLLHAW
ncbi:hypothetical protein ABBQ38_007451 [Trebouxia sp. C0009 RCD-2024]